MQEATAPLHAPVPCSCRCVYRDSVRPHGQAQPARPECPPFLGNQIAAFARRLRRHAATEEQVLYPGNYGDRKDVEAHLDGMSHDPLR